MWHPDVHRHRPDVLAAMFGACDPGSEARRPDVAAAAGEAIYRAGQVSEDIFLLREGWAMQVVQLENGRRQILDVLLPGDLCSYRLVFSPTLDFSIRTATSVRYSRFERAALKPYLVTRPDVFDALGSAIVAEDRRLSDLVVNLGQRSARERVAFVIFSLLRRLDPAGASAATAISFPIRQADLADIAGITPVHVSRLLAGFSRAGVLTLSRGRLTLNNRAALERIARIQ